MRWMRRALAFACVFTFTSGLASATLIRRLELPEMVSLAETIVEGRVEAVRSFWEGKRIWTEVTLRVDRSLKGAAPATLSFRQLGGRAASPVPVTMHVPGAPIHRVGDRGFYFLERTRDAGRIVVGLSRGRVVVRHDEAGAHLYFDGGRRDPVEFAEIIRRLVLEAGPEDRPAGPPR